MALAGDGHPLIDELALRVVTFGGERLDMPALRPWVARRALDRTALINMYGITETTVHTTYHPVTETDLDADHGNDIGVPLHDLQVQLHGPHGELVPIGVPGEIHVGGPGVARMYLGRPASPPNGSYPTRTARPAPVSTAAATSPAVAPTAASTTSAASTTRSRSAATASNSARSRPR